MGSFLNDLLSIKVADGDVDVLMSVEGLRSAEQISNVKNAWVHPIEDNLIGLKGLYSILIQFTDEVSPNEIESTVVEIQDLLMKNRSIGTDIENINVLKKDHISISGDITLNSFALGETVLAEIYQEIEKMFNQEIRFQDYDEMEKNGIPLGLCQKRTRPKSKVITRSCPLQK